MVLALVSLFGNQASMYLFIFSVFIIDGQLSPALYLLKFNFSWIQDRIIMISDSQSITVSYEIQSSLKKSQIRLDLRFL